MTDPAGARPAAGPAAAGNSGAVTHPVPAAPTSAAPWDSLRRLSSVQRTIEQFLTDHPGARAVWLVSGYAGGIALWLALPGVWQWLAVLALCAAAGLAALAWGAKGTAPWSALALGSMALALAAGMATIWLKADLAGAAPIVRPMAVDATVRVIARETGPAGTRLVIALVPPGAGRPIRASLVLPWTRVVPGLAPGAMLRTRLRLAPPAPPLVPGAHDHAFDAWFSGIAATAEAVGPITVVSPASDRGESWREDLAARIAARIGGSPGRIAAILATGPHQGLDPGDAQAMRDAGFAHLLVIGGLHVGVVIGAAWWIVLRGLALFPWLALRLRLPVVAALAGALAGVGYGVMTGGGVPTVRAVVVACGVLGAMVLGRDPLSLRLIALAAFVILLFSPESVVGAGFQLSFIAVVVVAALHQAEARIGLARQADDGWIAALLRRAAILLIGGIAIALALGPIALFHFHRTGVFGPWANLLAIPLVMAAAMPALAAALVLDPLGLAGPFWWIARTALAQVLAIARIAAEAPGSVITAGLIPGWTLVLWLVGILWLALWPARPRWWGLLPCAVALGGIALAPRPQIWVSASGRQVAFAGLSPQGLVMMSSGPGHVAADRLIEASGEGGQLVALEDWPGARCGHDICALALPQPGGRLIVTVQHSRRRLSADLIAPACAQSDIVIASTPLKADCHPRRLLIDAAVLARTGGLALDPARNHAVTVAQGRHPWLAPRALAPAADANGAPDEVPR